MKTITIDRKFIFTAVNPCNGKYYTEKDAIVFCAKDLCVLPMLYAYKDSCVGMGVEPNHIESIDLMIERVAKFQHDGMKKGICKLPDTDTDCEINRCIGGNLDE